MSFLRNLVWVGLLCCCCWTANCVDLDSNGGYSIVVGLSEDVVTAEVDPSEYIDNLKVLLDEFALHLYEATNSLFHIRLVRIVVPEAWMGALNASISIKATNTFNQADIQISGNTRVPFTENEYPCGKPGLRIHLPIDFINIDSHIGAGHRVYGPQGKGLLNLWLRYRFGVWEEHGYPGHEITPYVYNLNEKHGSPWHLTSCNGTEFSGEFEQFEDDSLISATCSCGEGWPSAPIGPYCRFHPDHNRSESETNTASSLMNFHWVESNLKLCGVDNHNKEAPNRQNLHCNFKSVWEVIQSTSDYKPLRHDHDHDQTTHHGIRRDRDAPAVRYIIVGPSPHPLLYLLVENSFPHYKTGAVQLYGDWREVLNLFAFDVPVGVVATAGSYPKVILAEATDEILTTFAWDLICLPSGGDNDLCRLQRIKLGRAMNTPDGGAYFDLRVGIAHAIAELKAWDHPHGSVLLVLRTELVPFVLAHPFTDLPERGLYEQDLVFELKQSGITLCALEITHPDLDGTWNNYTSLRGLEHMAAESGGRAAEVKFLDLEDAKLKMWSLLHFVNELVQHENVPLGFGYELVYKEQFPDLESLTAVIPRRKNLESLHIHVTVSGGQLETIQFQQGTIHGIPSNFNNFVHRREFFKFEGAVPWREKLCGHVCSLSLTKDQLEMETETGKWNLQLLGSTANKTDERIQGMITVYAYAGNDVNDKDNVLEAEISYTANAENNQFGCSSKDTNEEPLGIHVRLIGSRGQPIVVHQNGGKTMTIQANLLHLSSGSVTSFEMDDSGLAADLFRLDGVYSGHIYPRLVGWYQIYVTIYDAETTNSSMEIEYERAQPRVLPNVRQTDLGRYVEHGTTLSTPYSVAAVSPRLLHVTESCTVKKHITRITDLSVVELLPGVIKVRFTVPKIILSSDQMTSNRDNGRNEETLAGRASFSNNLNALVIDFYSGNLQHFDVDLTRPGSIAEIQLNDTGALFLAVQLAGLSYPPTRSVTSNVVKGWRPRAAEPEPEVISNGLTGCNGKCVLAISLGAGAALLAAIGVAMFYYRKSRLQKIRLTELTKEEVREFLHGVPPPPDAAPNEEDAAGTIQILPYDSKYEIRPNKLHVDMTELIGSGAFGNVYKGYVVNFGTGKDKVLLVAVKTMKPGIAKLNFKAMLAEVKLMAHICGGGSGAHPNIIRLVGASTRNIRKLEVFIATEFCVHGNLLAYLQKARFMDTDEEQQSDLYVESGLISMRNLIKRSREIANGMEFMARRRIVHGDLAARNILLDTSLVAKVSDFGLSKQLVQYGYVDYATKADAEEGNGGGLMPWKWLAPETLKHLKFSTASDVWALGITLWEIFSLGQVPYPGIQWSPEFVNYLEKSGLRLLKPDLATESVYALMRSCWELEPALRPDFSALRLALDELMIEHIPGDYMDVQQLSADAEYVKID